MCYHPRPIMLRSLRFHLSCCGILGWIAFRSLAATDAASSPLSPEFVKLLEAAQDETAQNEVIGSLKPSLPPNELRRQLLKHVSDLALQGNYPQALGDCELVLRLAREAGSNEDIAASRAKLGFVLREAGDIVGSLTAIDQALEFYRAHPKYIHDSMSAQQSRGMTYLAQSDFARALESFETALKLSRKLKDRESIITTLNSIGDVYRSQGEPERALEYYAKARREVGDDGAGNMSSIFNNIGMSYSALGDFDQAIEFVNRARAIAEKSNFRSAVRNCLAILGDLELKRGQPEAAADNFGQSLSLSRDLGDLPGEAKATLGLARVAFAEHRHADALQQAENAIALYRKLAATSELAEALTLSGKCLRVLNREDEARRSFWAAMGAIEDVRGPIAGDEADRETFFARELASYHGLISLFVRQKRLADALSIAERASARVLADITSGARAGLNSVLTPSEQKERVEIETGLASTERELAKLRTAESPDRIAIAKAENQRSELLENRRDFSSLVAAHHPEIRRATVPPPLSTTNELASLFSQGVDALLRYVVTEEESFLFIVRRETDKKEPALTVISLGKGRRELARLTNNFRSLLADRRLPWEKPAHDLSELLLRPAEKALGHARSIVIVPDGPLWELPFQVLEATPGQPLLAERTVRYAPSLTLIARSRLSPVEKTPQLKLLAFLNPTLTRKGEEDQMTKVALRDGSWQSLAQVEKQVPELRKIYPPPTAEVFVGATASEQVFKKKAAEADILHFAMHGLLDDRAPLFSYLLFSQINNAAGEDGRLEARELLQMQLRAKLAILCGCESTRGEVTAGEGIVGLSWGFMVAGCPATVVNQWEVDTASSTPLLIELHRQLQNGVESAEALRQASMSLREDPRYHHPFYWAPFILVGTSL
jgi:CHAT domain-containing protein/Tfp pilus assembly protein PilF